jgi:SNF2 family DNA or RNA helicase
MEPIPTLRLTARLKQIVDWGKHKGSAPTIVERRVVVADVEWERPPGAAEETRARTMLAAAGLPRSDASPVAWARFRNDALPQLERQGWRVEVDPGVNDMVLDLREPRAVWDARLESKAGEWFDVDLGVEIDGEHVALLPVIVDLLRSLDRGSVLQGDVTYATVGDRAVVLPVERIRSILEILVELHDEPRLSSKGRLQLSRLAALNLAQTASQISAEDERARRLGALARRLADFEGIPDVAIPQTLRATLRGYQHEGYRWLQFLRQYDCGGILADDMGLGKSIQTITHLLREKERSCQADSLEARPSLLVVPTSLVPNWLAELERFAPSLRVTTLHGAQRKNRYAELETADLAITTYALLLRDELFLERDWHIAILDEAQAIKNPNSKVARAASKLRARQRICLTGTPMENHLGELWSLFDFVMPHALYDQRRFARLFRTPIEKESSSERRDVLARRIRPFVLRRTKADVALQLPEKTEIVERVELAEDQRDLYESVRLAVHEEVRREIERLGMARSRIAVLDALLKLRQVCCDPRLVRLQSAARAHSSAKLAWLVENLAQLAEEGRRTLVFSQFTSMLDLIKPELERAGIPFVELVGSTVDRATPVRRFQAGEVPVFLISLRAGGTGLNLTAADTVIHYDPWWNPAVERQATDRAHRIGQDKPVFVYKLIAAGTVEEKILNLQAHKAALAGALFDATKAESIELTAADVEELFKPLLVEA